MASIVGSRRGSTDPYMELVRAFPLRPIRREAMAAAGRGILRGLAGRDDPAANDYKYVLASLVADYERWAGHLPEKEDVTATELIRRLLDERGVSVDQLAEQVDVSPGALADMLEGHCDWSRSAMVGVCGFFGLRPELFLR